MLAGCCCFELHVTAGWLGQKKFCLAAAAATAAKPPMLHGVRRSILTSLCWYFEALAVLSMYAGYVLLDAAASTDAVIGFQLTCKPQDAA
jgi:hypothetical protein